MGQVNELKDFTRGQIDAALMKIGQDAGMDTAKGIYAFLRGDLVASPPSRQWYEHDDVVYFSVTSDGTTGEEWVARLEAKGVPVHDHIKRILRSPDLKQTSGVKTKIAVLKGIIFGVGDVDDGSHGYLTTDIVRAEANRRNLVTPSVEVALLVREKFAKEEIKVMGLTNIVTMHDLTNDPEYGRCFLFTGRNGEGDWNYNAQPWFLDVWPPSVGFAFAVSSPSAKSSAEKQVGTQQ